MRIFTYLLTTVKRGDKEHLDKDQLGVKELFTDYQPFHIINLHTVRFWDLIHKIVPEICDPHIL